MLEASEQRIKEKCELIGFGIIFILIYYKGKNQTHILNEYCYYITYAEKNFHLF